MNLIKPKLLKKGDTIGILGVAGAIYDENKLYNASQFFEKQGYNVIFSDTCFKKNDYFSGTHKERLNALHSFFENDKINAILCARGGYGAITILNQIDYNIIKNNPKIFAGYSDITAFLLMFYKKANLMTFHSPMAVSDFSSPNNFTTNNFFNTISKEISSISINDGSVYKHGTAEGILWGGNLSTISSIIGLDFIPNDENLILIIEDLNEPVYKIDRMLTQLLNINSLKSKIKGILIGDFIGIDNKQFFDNLFLRISSELNIPIMSGLKISHSDEKITLPIGCKACFSTEEKILHLKL